MDKKYNEKTRELPGWTQITEDGLKEQGHCWFWQHDYHDLELVPSRFLFCSLQLPSHAPLKKVLINI